jgi:riboflavin biosynthesis pyrimidine reductase
VLLMKQVPEVKVMANILLARNLATSLGGSSRALSPESDRIRFHQIRTLAKAILIGGQSYRNEPYSKLSLPLYISSRTLSEGASDSQFIFNQEPAWLIKRALLEQGCPVLIEGGVNFISSLITQSLIDLLYITRVNQDGDGHFFDESQLLKNYERQSIEIIDGASFETWRVKLESSD